MENVDWNKFAQYYNMVSKLENEYTLNQINCLNITSEDTVLDIGCGPGRLAVPIAKRAKSVTALDAFESMLKICNENARDEGVCNIATRLGDWNSLVINKTIHKHDIVIASRSIGMLNPEKLNKAAKKYAVMIGWIKDGSPSIGALFKGILEDNSQSFSKPDDPIRNYINGYQFAFNKVYDMGVMPNLRVVKDGFKRNYPSREAAYGNLSRLHEFPAKMLPIFKRNVNRFLTFHKDGSVTYCCERWSYVLWWQVKN
ncbi:class I SAM-dependent methyltransferase [Clostridium luticellarii]|uniref:Bifunctional 3-demethylubiquinone-9 3-methyltransferase/ 2-octaprenyl-6-hydroxy phenol methylase n=1 Tax=Clostridium luticellarii TaxID=1691940 RepID=A0A2T0B6H1_9CLOT|nr:class I SAM-dependent methyltransferase [Clostridium luticellarii]PRR79491.1 bifunctional 3-demethylubiquinone-9 3-methyltransferase/ 2-octaprenyl-6-hydroxy phenol methylase [Clostridium luticellarii]